MKQAWRQFLCWFGGHDLAHRAIPAYRARLNYCVRCECPVYVRALKDVSDDGKSLY